MRSRRIALLLVVAVIAAACSSDGVDDRAFAVVYPEAAPTTAYPAVDVEGDEADEIRSSDSSVGDCVTNWLTFGEWAFRPGDAEITIDGDLAIVDDPGRLDLIGLWPGVTTELIRDFEVRDGIRAEVERALRDGAGNLIFVGRASIIAEFQTLLVDETDAAVRAFDPCLLEWRDITERFREGAAEIGAANAAEAIALLVSDHAARDAFSYGWAGEDRRAQENAVYLYPGVEPGDPSGGCDPDDSRARRALLNEPLTWTYIEHAAAIDALLNDHDSPDAEIAVEIVALMVKTEAFERNFADAAEALEWLLAQLAPSPECADR